MSFLTAIPDKPRRTDQGKCPSCGTGAITCHGLEWLRDARCCEACTGNHDEGTTDAA